MKKLLTLLIFCFTVACVPVKAQIFTINSFTEIQKVGSTIELTTPIDVQYALKQNLKANFYNSFVFEAAGAGHTFTGSGVIINDVPIVAGIGVQPIANQPITVGVCAGINAWNGKFIAGISTDILLTPLTTVSERMTPKKKHQLKISL